MSNNNDDELLMKTSDKCEKCGKPLNVEGQCTNPECEKSEGS